MALLVITAFGQAPYPRLVTEHCDDGSTELALHDATIEMNFEQVFGS